MKLANFGQVIPTKLNYLRVIICLVVAKKSFMTQLTHTGHAWALTGTPRSCLVGSCRELTFLFFGRFQEFQRQIMCLMNFEYFLPKWSTLGMPGRCLEGVTPGSAGIFSALSYFVAETPTMFKQLAGLF